MTHPNRPYHAIRRETDAALSHVERDLAPVEPSSVPWWCIIAGYFVLALVIWWFGP